MRLTDLTRQACEWLRCGGPLHDVVISSRIRLARNISGMPFLSRCSYEQRAELEARLRKEILEAGIAPEVFYIDVASAGELDRQLLVERHLISRQHALGVESSGHASSSTSAMEASRCPRGVAVAADETVAIMVNEEDHLRIQVLRAGLQLEQAFDEINRIDDLLETKLDFAFHNRYGYLTACPTNVGTGLRVSVMLHLPALKMTGEIEKAFRAARDMHLAIRGLYGEGTEASGDFFQISNQSTLGRSEQQVIEEFRDQLLPEFIQYEQRARNSLFQKNSASMEDKIFRAMAILRSARIVSSDETMFLLSLARLGVNSGTIRDLDIKTINELFLLTQPAHLQKILATEMTPLQRGAARADFIRKRMG